MSANILEYDLWQKRKTPKEEKVGGWIPNKEHVD